MTHIAEGVYWLAVSATVSGLIATAIPGLAPKPRTEDFLEVREVRVERSGASADLWVDRTIKHALHMQWTVRVLEWSPAGWEQFCIARGGPLLYRPDVVMDQPVTLYWWTDGACHVLPPGRAMVETTWAPTAPGMEPITVSAEVAE